MLYLKKNWFPSAYVIGNKLPLVVSRTKWNERYSLCSFWISPMSMVEILFRFPLTTSLRVTFYFPGADAIKWFSYNILIETTFGINPTKQRTIDIYVKKFEILCWVTFLAKFCERFFYRILDYLLVNRSVCAQRQAIFLVSAEPKRLTPAPLSIIKYTKYTCVN
jgi:hypothetical protein